jgi:hypothetical protein
VVTFEWHDDDWETYRQLLDRLAAHDHLQIRRPL